MDQSIGPDQAYSGCGRTYWLNWLHDIEGLIASFAVGVAVTLAATGIMRMGWRKGSRLIAILSVLAAFLWGGGYAVNAWTHYRIEHGVAALRVEVLARTDSNHSYGQSIIAHTGQTIEYVMIVTDFGDGEAHDVAFGVNQAPLQMPVCGSPRLVDSNTSSEGIHLSSRTPGSCFGDGIYVGGIYIDDMAPGASEELFWKEILVNVMSPGVHSLKTWGVVSGQGIRQAWSPVVVRVSA